LLAGHSLRYRSQTPNLGGAARTSCDFDSGISSTTSKWVRASSSSVEVRRASSPSTTRWFRAATPC
jgi:hypothetical protein